MCGRVVQVLPGNVLEALFGAAGANPLAQSWNRGPESSVVYIVNEGGVRQVRVGRWGLVPSTWEQDEPLPLHTFNARAEMLMERAASRALVRSQRCVVPVDGWYEWKDRQPYYFRARSGRALALAALWDGWDGPNGHLRSVMILTTSARGSAARVHPRMPVVLNGPPLEEWLSGRPLEELPRLRNDPITLTVRRVSTWVNRVGHDDSHCVDPVDED